MKVFLQVSLGWFSHVCDSTVWVGQTVIRLTLCLSVFTLPVSQRPMMQHCVCCWCSHAAVIESLSVFLWSQSSLWTHKQLQEEDLTDYSLILMLRLEDMMFRLNLSMCRSHFKVCIYWGKLAATFLLQVLICRCVSAAGNSQEYICLNVEFVTDSFNACSQVLQKHSRAFSCRCV